MINVKINPANWICSKCGRHPNGQGVGAVVKCACGWPGMWLLTGGPQGAAADRECRKWAKKEAARGMTAKAF